MKRDDFLLKDRLTEIQSLFVKNGWVTIYESGSSSILNQSLIYCCIVDKKRFKEYSKNRNWEIDPGKEGKPSIISCFQNGKWKSKYHTYSDEGFEPFIYSRFFSGISEKYIDISEEFILYFNLFERLTNKQNRKYYFIDDVGELEEVIVIESNSVKIKLKFLIEYISVRNVHFAICFDFMKLEKGSLAEHGIEFLDKDFEAPNFFFNHYVGHLTFPIDGASIQSWLHGKVFILFDKTKTQTHHFDSPKKYEEFITSYDNDGNEVFQSCDKQDRNPFILTYFRKEVLNKYYYDPSKYKVDGWYVQCSFFSLKIDNHNENYVAVFLKELAVLPHREQLHWKQYNIPPQGGMSSVYYKTMIEGSWSEHPGTADLFFKEKYASFNKKWLNKYGWEFYLPLAIEETFRFTSLHIPTTNNIKAFCEQMLSLVKITIDSLNESKMAKGLACEENEKGIVKFEKFLKHKNVEIPEMIEFLRHLQNLRSGLIAHRFSHSNSKLKKALTYFDIKDDNLISVATDIFEKSINTMNTMEAIFLK